MMRMVGERKSYVNLLWLDFGSGQVPNLRLSGTDPFSPVLFFNTLGEKKPSPASELSTLLWSFCCGPNHGRGVYFRDHERAAPMACALAFQRAHFAPRSLYGIHHHPVALFAQQGWSSSRGDRSHRRFAPTCAYLHVPVDAGRRYQNAPSDLAATCGVGWWHLPLARLSPDGRVSRDRADRRSGCRGNGGRTGSRKLRGAHGDNAQPRGATQGVRLEPGWPTGWRGDRRRPRALAGTTRP